NSYARRITSRWEGIGKWASRTPSRLSRIACRTACDRCSAFCRWSLVPTARRGALSCPRCRCRSPLSKGSWNERPDAALLLPAGDVSCRRMKLQQGQVWKAGEEFLRIVELHRLAVKYKAMNDLL